MSTLQKFIREEEGADLIEYALLAGIISLGCALTLTNVATSLNSFFGHVNTTLAAIVP